jgi:predicted dehydrogenase
LSVSFNPYGGQLAFGAEPPSEDLGALAANVRRLGEGAVVIAVPTPNLERAQAIAAACGLPEAAGPAVEQLDALVSRDQQLRSAPPACVTDLEAVTAAIQTN